MELPTKKPRLAPTDETELSETNEDLQERMEVIKQKNVQRKATRKSNPVTKADRRRIKVEKLQKRQKIQNLKDMITTERATVPKGDKKPDPEKLAKSQPKVYNKEGKLLFSKVQIEGEDKKRSKGVDTNPQNNLQKLKKQKKKIRELIESGDKSKAKDEKHKMLWKSAFDKTEGLKVKDNEDVLKKSIKTRKNIKKKSKEKWIERKKKVEEKQSTHLKKREENLNKRRTDNQKNKTKKAAKKGRVF